MKKIHALIFTLTLLPLQLWAAAPADFRLVYESSAGNLPAGTRETIQVDAKQILVQTQTRGSEGGEFRTKEDRYAVSPEQADKLYQIVATSGFFDWPTTAPAPHESQADEWITVTANGRTVKRSKWERLEPFRRLYADFNRWFVGVRSVRF